MTTCPLDPKARPAYHRTLIEGPLDAWLRLKPRGTQTVEADGGLPGYELDLRDCECGSTISRELGPKLAGDDLTAHIRDILERFVKDRLSKSHFRTGRQEPYIVLQANIGTKVFLDHMAKAITDELEKEAGPGHCPGCDGDHL